MRHQALVAVLLSMLWITVGWSQDAKIFEVSAIARHQVALMEARRAARLDSLRRALKLSSDMSLDWTASSDGSDVFQIVDHFNRSEIGSDWSYDGRYWKIVDGEMSTTAAADQEWRYLAVFLPVSNDGARLIKSVSYRWGKNVDALGVREGAMALMLNGDWPGASGYWLWHRYGGVWLWIIKNGAWEYTPGEGKEVDRQQGLGDPVAGDVVTGVVRNEDDAVYFDYYINDQLSATVKDFTKEFPQGSPWYVGLFIHGEQLHNRVDDFTVTWIEGDGIAPAAVTDLQAVDSTASSVTLEWTSTGDNDFEGDADRFELRYSTSPINEDNFFSAKRVGNLPPPFPPGQKQAFTVTGLETQKIYYFAIKLFDEVNNASGISNIVKAGSPAMTICTDSFNRANGDLGADWGGDLTHLQIRNNAVENVQLSASWSAAVYRNCRNAIAVSLKYGTAAVSSSISASGLLLMADSPAATANGYMIQHDDANTPNNDSDDRTHLWLVQNGQPVSVIQGGQSQSPPPQAGSIMNVNILDVDGVRKFYVYIDGILDRVLSDPNRLQNGSYAGFFLKSGHGGQNAVDEFSVRTPRGGPKALLRISGNGQINGVGQPLPLPLTVALIDSFDNPLSEAVIRFAVTSGEAIIPSPPSQDGNLRLEAEEAKITAPLERRLSAAASGGQYIVYPVGQTVDASATFSFTIARAGTYWIWTRSMKTGSQPGSWFMSVDGSPNLIYDVFQNTTKSAWTWDFVSARGTGNAGSPQFDPKTFNFSVGTHTVVFNARWADTQLDKILITSDANYTPNDREDGGFITDASGQTSAKVILGDKTGVVKIQASYGDLPPVSFTATASSAPTKLVMNSGSGQSGPAGQLLPQPFKVMVQDNSGKGVAGQLVNWVVTAGNGTLSWYTSLSDNNGIASTVLTLGNWSADNKVEARAAFSSTSIVFIATTSSGVANKAAVISGNSQTGVVHTALSAPLVVKVSTAAGQPVANFPVEFRVTRGGGSLSPNLVIRNEGFELANTSTNLPSDWTLEGAPTVNEVSLSPLEPWQGAKSLQINAARDGVGISQTWNYPDHGNFTLSFYAKVASGVLRMTWRLNDAAGHSIDKIIDLTHTANGDKWRPYVISASNSSAKPLSLSFKIFGGAGKFFIDEVKINRHTDSKGEIEVNWTLGDTAMTQRVQAEAKVGNLTSIGSPLLFSATATPGPAKKMVALSGNNQSGSLGQVLSAPLVVKVTDEFGNGLANRSVKFSMQAGGGKLNGNLAAYSTNTDQQGLAQAKWTLGAVFGATNKVQVTSTGLNAINFVALIATPSNVTLAGAPVLGSAGHRLSRPLVVRVTDAKGTKISGYPVIFKIRQGNGTINDSAQAVIHTDSLGEARAYPVLGPAPGAQNRIDAWIEYKGKILPSPMLSFTVTAARLKQMALVSGNNQTGAGCEALAEPFKVKITDSLGVGITGQRVTFTVTNGGGKLNGDTAKVVFTDAQGIAQIKLTLGPKPGANQATAKAAIALAGSPQTFNANGQVGLAALLRKFSADSLAAIVNTVLPSPLVVRVTDKCGNDVANAKVTFTIKAGGGKLNGKNTETLFTDANGRAQVSWQVGPMVGKFNNKTEVRVFNNNIEIANSLLLFVASGIAGVISAEASEVRGTSPIPADGVSKSRVTVYLRDHAGNPIAGEAVTIKVSPDGNHFIDQPIALTDQEGKATAAFASTSTGTKIVTAAVLDGIELTRGATVQVKPLAAQNMSLAVGNNQTCNVQAAAVKPLSVKIEDKFGNGVPNHEVRFTIKGEGRILELAPIRTDTNGIARVTFIGGARPGQSQVWAQSSSLVNALIIFVVNVTQPVPQHLVEVSGNLQRGLAGQILPRPILVRIIDGSGRPVFGAPVQFDVTFGGGTINGLVLLNAETDAWGEVQANWRLGSTLGPQAIRVESAVLKNSPVDFRAETVSGLAARMNLDSGQNAVGEVGQTLPQPLCVRVTDANGNGIDNTEVLFELIQGSGSFAGAAPIAVKQVLTTNEGFACAQMTFGTDAGWRRVRASVEGLRGSPVDFHVYGKARQARTMQAIERTNNQRGTKGKPLNFPLQVLVQDELGNPVIDESITFSITNGGGSFNGATLTRFEAKTDSNGIAAAPWTLGRSSSVNEANATGQLSSINFQATGFDNNFPFFANVPDRRVTEGDVIEFTVSATDADGDPIIYGAKNLPADAQFDSLRTRIFRWRTGLNSAGHYELSFLARDNNGGVDEELVIIEVKNRNRMPVIVSRFPDRLGTPTQSDTVVAFNTVLPMFIEAHDPDNDPLQYRWFLNGADAGSATNTFLLRSNTYFNTVKVLVFDRMDTASTTWTIQVSVKSNSISAAPKTFVLEQNYPNPFSGREAPAGASLAFSGGNSSTQIRYALPQSAYVTLTIFNAIGQEVRRLVDDQQPAGYHVTVWDGRDQQGKSAPSGIYHYRLQAGDLIAVKKMVLAR